MQERKVTGINPKYLGITFLISLIVGFLFGIWAIILDPKGTGGSILMIPVIFTLFPICIALLCTGIISTKASFGRYLAAASFLIPVSFFISKELLQWVIN